MTKTGDYRPMKRTEANLDLVTFRASNLIILNDIQLRNDECRDIFSCRQILEDKTSNWTAPEHGSDQLCL